MARQPKIATKIVLDTDITELKRQVAALEERLVVAQKTTALGELLGTTTHEFNNILMTVLNYAKLGLRSTDEPTRNKAFEKILIAANRANKITNSILAIAKNRKPQKEPTDLTALLDDALIILEREMSKYRITIERKWSPVPEIMADGNQILQVILNMLINARQAMPNGGRLIIRLSHDEKTKTVDCMIRDFGCGISPEKLPHIFEPYFTTKEGPDDSGKGGTGLGLAMCKKIVESHRAKIRVESAVGKGTAFTLRFPAITENGQ